MSVQSEIDRISTNVNDTLSNIEEMGGEVPANATSNDMAAAVLTIPVGAKIDDTAPSTTTTYSSSKIDSLLNEQKEAIDAQDERLTKLEQTAPSGTSGLTIAQVNALNGMFKVAAYIKSDVSAEYEAFKTAFGIEDSGSPEEPEKTLTGISAVYNGGDVAVGTALTALTGIVVTATYSDGSTATVTDYTLSGQIAEGSNTITVGYGGKTATFTVTGIAESGDSDNLAIINSNTAKNHDATEFLINSDNSITVTGPSSKYGYLLVNGLKSGTTYEVSMNQTAESEYYYTSVYGSKVENATDDSGYNTKYIGFRNFAKGNARTLTLRSEDYGLIIYLYGSPNTTPATNTFSDIVVKEL